MLKLFRRFLNDYPKNLNANENLWLLIQKHEATCRIDDKHSTTVIRKEIHWHILSVDHVVIPLSGNEIEYISRKHSLS